MTSSIVITGATGFIGRALSKKLEEKKEFSVIKVTRSQEQEFGFNSVVSYEKTPPGDILIHLAEDPDRLRVNNMGNHYRRKTGIVMESLLKKRYKKIVYCSSSIVYGDQGTKLYKENMPTYAEDIYSISKLENEDRVLLSGGVVVRFSNVIGVGMSKNNVLSKILEGLSGKDSISIRNPKPIRDFICIDDVVEAIFSLIKVDAPGIYNIGSGIETSINKLVETVLNSSEQHHREVKNIIKNNDYSYNALNIEKIKETTGWKPEYTLSQSVKKILMSNKNVKK